MIIIRNIKAVVRKKEKQKNVMNVMTMKASKKR